MNALLQQFLSAARRRPVVVISIAVLVLVGIANYFLWQRQQDLAGRHERIRTQGEEMLLALAGHTRVQSQLASVEEALAYIDRNLFIEADLAGNLDYFYQLEKSTRVRLNNLSQLSAQPVEADAVYQAVPFSLRMTGQYYQLVGYLHGVETGPRLMRVRNFNLSRRDDTGDMLSLDLTLEVLSRP